MAKKKKKVTVYQMPKAQEGMQMAEGAPQEQGGGQDQMQQLAMQVQQMLEQGADPTQVVAQLVQGGVPPQVIAQIFVGLGMPEQEVIPMIEQVMQQMQGAQQQAPPQEGMAPEGQPMMAEGGESEQEQMQQLVMMFAQMSGAEPQQIVEALQSGELTVEQMVTAIQEAQQQTPAVNGQVAQSPQEQMMQQAMKRGGMVPPGYHRMPDGSIMADSAHMDDGGMVNEARMGAVNPTKKDFLQLKKEVIKKYKGGGDVKSFDSSSTEALLQNMEGAISNYVAKNLRLGMVTKGMKEMKKFNELPKAKGGADITDQMLIDQYNLSQEQYNSWKTNPEARKQLVAEYQKDFPEYADASTSSDNSTGSDTPTYNSGDGTQGYNNMRSATPGVIDPNTGRPMSWEQLDAMGGWKGFTEQYGDPKYYSTSNQGARHYYPGYGPGQRSLGGRYFNQRLNKTPLYDLFTSFGKQGTGKYNIEGYGELANANVEQIGAKMSEIAADPSKYNFRVSHGYLNRRGKMKKRPGLFGRPEAVQFDYVGQQGAPTNGETEDQVADDMTYDASQDAFVDAAGLQNYAGTRYDPQYLNEAPDGTMLYTDPVTGEQTAISPEEAERMRAEAEGPMNWQDFRVDPRWLTTFANSTEVTAEGDQTTAGVDTYRQELERKIADGTATRKERKAYKDVYGKEAAKEIRESSRNPYYGKTPDEIRQLVTDPAEAEKIINKMQAKKDEAVSTGVDVNPYTAQIDANYQAAAEMAGTTDERSEAFQKALDIVEGADPATYNKETGLYEYYDFGTGQTMQYRQPRGAYLGEGKSYGPVSREDLLADPNTDEYTRKMAEVNPDWKWETVIDRAPPGQFSQAFDPYKGFYMHGGMVSQPGRPVWDWRNMSFKGGPNSALLFAKKGQYVNFPTKEEMEGYSVDPTGSARIVEEQERVRDWKKFGQAAYDTAGWITDKLEAIQQTTPTWEATAERQKMIAANDIGSGAMGLYNQWGDPRFGQSGQVGAGVRAGTGSDQDVYGNFSQQNLYEDLMPGQTRWGSLKKGGLVMAQLGLEVGDELELTEADIMELAKYGYEITRM